MIHTFITTGGKTKLGTLSALGSALILSCIGSRAVAALPATLPANEITSSTPHNNVVESFARGAVEALSSSNTVEQRQARDAIISPLLLNGAEAASEAFKFTYTSSLNAQLLPLASNPNWRVRLNAAIVAAKVSEHVQNDKLEPTIEQFLRDENEAVALWAVKASKPMLASAPAMVTAVADAAKKFPALAQAAYEALSVDPQTSIIDAMQDILAARIASYASGVPTNPLAEKIAINQLVSTKWWPTQNPQQKNKTAQAMVDLAQGVITQFPSKQDNDQLEDLREVIRSIGSGMASIGIVDSTRSQLMAPGQDVKKLARATALSDVQAKVDRVKKELKAAFPAITVP